MNASSGSGLWPTRRTGAAVVVASVMKMASKVGGQCTREERERWSRPRRFPPKPSPARHPHGPCGPIPCVPRDPHGGLPPEFSPVAVSRTRVMRARPGLVSGCRAGRRLAGTRGRIASGGVGSPSSAAHRPKDNNPAVKVFRTSHWGVAEDPRETSRAVQGKNSGMSRAPGGPVRAPDPAPGPAPGPALAPRPAPAPGTGVQPRAP